MVRKCNSCVWFSFLREPYCDWDQEKVNPQKLGCSEHETFEEVEEGGEYIG
jgi:hypothetical protein